MAHEVLYEVEGRIAVITLNRPEARNAVNGAVATAMHDIMHRFESDPEVWVAILTGAGNQAFSAGADLKAMASGEGRLIETKEGGFSGFVRFPRTKPVIAAVNGLALAGGTELVLACDMMIVVEEAEFGLPWARSAEARTRVMQTADAQEGPRAFAEKREPTWIGR